MLFTSPGRRSLKGHRRRFSTLTERTTFARTAGNRTALLLQFYVLFSIFYTFSLYAVPYGLEGSTLVILLGLYAAFIDYSTGGRILGTVYDNIAVPLLGYYGNRIVDGSFQGFRYMVNIVSPILRSLYFYTVYGCAPYASVYRLVDLENGIQRSRGDINYEKHQRRVAEIRGNGDEPVDGTGEN